LTNKEHTWIPPPYLFGSNRWAPPTTIAAWGLPWINVAVEVKTHSPGRIRRMKAFLLQRMMTYTMLTNLPKYWPIPVKEIPAR